MRLFIAEKPSLARAIADVLPGPRLRRDGYLQCGPDDVVAWCAGHILELAPPDAYDPAFKQWRIDHLPIAPADWKLVVSTPDLLKTIKALLPKAHRVVNAGDPDREGQLLVDEVLQFLGYRGPVDRLLVSDLNPPAVKAALAEIHGNGRHRGLYEAALARQRADWLFGINLTRLYTLIGRAGGYDGVLSVGRVQTPLLGLIVRRDLEIERFQARAYHVISAEIRCPAGTFTATWQAPVNASGILDDSERLISQEHAVAVKAKVAGRSGVVARCTREKKAEPAPLPYSLPALQIDAGKRLALSPKQVLDACQALYETHRLLTYPRSDSSYLPEGHHRQGPTVLSAIAANAPALAASVSAADQSRRSKAWDDRKVTAHHAIIPTQVAATAGNLSTAERGVYELVARRYLAQFFPAFEFEETKIELEIVGERFGASGRRTLAEGWRTLLAPVRSEEARESDEPAENAAAPSLPLLRQGDTVACTGVSILDKQTTPAKRFTDAGLVQAMTGIARFVDDPEIKRLLRETDGIGTPATQAQIIQTLFERKFIEKRGREVRSTAIGRALIQSLPAVATKPDMTALWEAAMRRIADGQMPLESFLDAVIKQLGELIASGRALGALRMPPVPPPDGRPPRKRARTSGRARPHRPARQKPGRRP